MVNSLSEEQQGVDAKLPIYLAGKNIVIKNNF